MKADPEAFTVFCIQIIHTDHALFCIVLNSMLRQRITVYEIPDRKELGIMGKQTEA